jgi:hypothetical protein
MYHSFKKNTMNLVEALKKITQILCLSDDEITGIEHEDGSKLTFIFKVSGSSYFVRFNSQKTNITQAKIIN